MYNPQNINKNATIVAKLVIRYGFLFLITVIANVAIMPKSIIGVINNALEYN